LINKLNPSNLYIFKENIDGITSDYEGLNLKNKNDIVGEIFHLRTNIVAFDYEKVNAIGFNSLYNDSKFILLKEEIVTFYDIKYHESFFTYVKGIVLSLNKKFTIYSLWPEDFTRIFQYVGNKNLI
jgi:hypothetical protein